jgi:hypothetical protein
MPSTELSRRLSQLADAAGYGPRNRAKLFEILRGPPYVIGVSSLQTMQNWFSGERRPEAGHLRVLLDALGVYGPTREQIVRDLWLPDGLLPSSSNREEAEP